MAIQFQIECSNSVVRVKASGKDDSLEQVENYGMAIIDAALSFGFTKILCDETDLEYSLDTFESFEAAKFIAEHAPRISKTAIVCKPSSFDDSAFWETVAINRGLHVKMCKTLDEAEEWLK